MKTVAYTLGHACISHSFIFVAKPWLKRSATVILYLAAVFWPWQMTFFFVVKLQDLCEILDRTLSGRRVASCSTGFMHAVEVCSHAGVEDLHTVVEMCSSM